MIYVKMMFLPYFTPNTHYTQCALAIPVRMSMSSFSSSSIVTLSISIVSLWHAVGYCFRRCCTMLEMLLFQILKLKSIHLTFWESCSLYFLNILSIEKHFLEVYIFDQKCSCHPIILMKDFFLKKIKIRS